MSRKPCSSSRMAAAGRELLFDPADVNVRSSVQSARSRQSVIGQSPPFGPPALKNHKGSRVTLGGECPRRGHVELQIRQWAAPGRTRRSRSSRSTLHDRPIQYRTGARGAARFSSARAWIMSGSTGLTEYRAPPHIRFLMAVPFALTLPFHSTVPVRGNIFQDQPIAE